MKAQPLLGVEGGFENVSDDTPSGFRVARVNAQTTADVLGIRIGDLITHMGVVSDDKAQYKAIDSAARLKELVKATPVGTKISVQLIRGNKDLTVKGVMKARPVVLDLLGQAPQAQMSGMEIAWEDVHSAIDSGDVDEGTRALSDFIVEHYDGTLTGRSVDVSVLELLDGATPDFVESWRHLNQGILQSFRQRGVDDPRVLSAASIEEDFETVLTMVFTLQMEAGRLAQAGRTLRTAAYRKLDVPDLRLAYVERLASLIDPPALSRELAQDSDSLLTPEEKIRLKSLLAKYRVHGSVPERGSGFISPIPVWNAPRHPARGFVIPKDNSFTGHRMFKPSVMVFESQPPVVHDGTIRCVTDYPAESATEWAIESSTGRVLWSREYDSPQDYSRVLHYLSSGEGVCASVIVWQSDEDQSYAVDVTCHSMDGQLLWTRRLDDILPHGVYLPVMPPVVWGPLVVLPLLETSSGGALRLVALQTSSSEVEWITTPESTHDQQMFRNVFTRFLGCISGGALVVAPMNGTAIGYDLMSGCRIWKARLDNPRPIQRFPDQFFTQGFVMDIKGKVLLRQDNQDTVYLMDGASGTPIDSAKGGWLVPAGHLGPDRPLFLAPGHLATFTSLDQSKLDIERKNLPPHEAPKCVTPWGGGCLIDTGTRLMRMMWEGGLMGSFSHDPSLFVVSEGDHVALFNGTDLSGYRSLSGEPSEWVNSPEFVTDKSLQTAYVMHCLNSGELGTLADMSPRIDPAIMSDPVVESQACSSVVAELERGERTKIESFLTRLTEGRPPESPLKVLLAVVRGETPKAECLYDMGSGRIVTALGLSKFLARKSPDGSEHPTPFVAPTPSRSVSLEMAYANGKRFMFAVDDAHVILQDRITLYNLDTQTETRLKGSCLYAADGRMLTLNNNMLSMHTVASGLSTALWTVPYGNAPLSGDPGQDFMRQLLINQQRGAMQVQANFNFLLMQKQRAMAMQRQQNGMPQGIRFEGPFFITQEQEMFTCRLTETGEKLWMANPELLVDMSSCIRKGSRFYEARWSQDEGKAEIRCLDAYTGLVTTTSVFEMPGDEYPLTLHDLPSGWLVASLGYWARVSDDGTTTLVNGGASIESDPFYLLGRTVSGDFVFQCQSGGVGVFSPEGKRLRMVAGPLFSQPDLRTHIHGNHLLLSTNQKVALVDLETGLGRGEWPMPGNQAQEPMIAMAFGGDSCFVMKLKTGIQRMNVYRFSANTRKFELITNKDMMVQSLMPMGPLVSMMNPTGTWFLRFR
ncbi:MAG: hypothetical protein AB7F75_05180 [Planctomycetota bacterium]